MTRAFELVLLAVVGCGGRVTGIESESSTPTNPDAGPLTMVDGSVASQNSPDLAMLCATPDAGYQAVVAKSFLVTGSIPGWNLDVSIVSATPALSSVQGAEWTGAVSFSIEFDQIQLIGAASGSPPTVPVVDAWPAANVASESCLATSNGHWQTQTWVVWDFDKPDELRIDTTDLGVFGASGSSPLPAFVTQAAARSTALVPGSFSADEAAGMLQWQVSISETIACPDVPQTQLDLQVAYTFTRL
jgi:hypothetical protein